MSQNKKPSKIKRHRRIPPPPKIHRDRSKYYRPAQKKEDVGED